MTKRRPILCITRGLPGSGKTTRAKEIVSADPDHWARVSRDLLREHVYVTMPLLSPAGERQMTGLHHLMVRHLLQAGRNVIVDDTNLYDQVVTAWADLAAECGADFQILDLRDVPIEECIARDQA